MSDITEHEDGVWIGLSHESYISDMALGYSALKTLLNSPPNFWWKSKFNSIEPPVVKSTDDDKAHYRLGTATHVACLEGMDVYERTYGVLPGAEDFPDALVSKNDLIEAAKSYRISYSGLDKADLGRRLLSERPGIQILDFIRDEWRLEGLRELTAAEDRRIRLIQQMITRSDSDFKLPGEGATTLAKAFSGGLSEVSVFWTDEHGVRQRARFDKLKPRATIDLKTFASWREDLDFDRGLLREVKHRGYLMQVAHYEEGRKQLRRLVDEGKVFGGSAAERKMLATIAKSEVWGWLFIFAITRGAPMVKGLRFNLGGIVFGEWMIKRQEALSKFMEYREMFGFEEGRMWFDPVSIAAPDDDEWNVA